MKINQQFTSLGIFALLGSVLSGCASQQSAVFAHSTEGSVLMSSSGPQAVADAEILDVFEELFGNAPATAPTQGNRVGPSLIAGDWLGGVTTIQAITAEDALLRGHLPSGPEDLFIALSSPHVHLATWLTGRHAQRVTAQTSRNVAAGFDDGAVATVVLRGEVPCTFSASRLARAEAFAVHGTDGGTHAPSLRVVPR